jgi:hypothetical protein
LGTLLGELLVNKSRKLLLLTYALTHGELIQEKFKKN